MEVIFDFLNPDSAPNFPKIMFLLQIDWHCFIISGSILGVLIFLVESLMRKNKESRESSVVKPFLA